MRSNCINVVCVSTLLLAGAAASTARADVVTFKDLTINGIKSVNDMSPDGRWLVGTTGLDTPYLYDTVQDVMIELPSFDAAEGLAVSDDGQVVLANIASFIDGEYRQVAGIWRPGDFQWTSLGYLPNVTFGGCPSYSSAYELNADGSVAVGLGWDGCNARAFRWTQATGMVEMQSLANGNCRASVVSDDGNVLAGFAQGSFSRTPAVWTANGAGQLIDPPNGDVQGEVHAINGAGTMLLGERNGKAVMWTFPGLAVTQIGGGSALPGWTGIPQDIDANGTVVGFDILLGNRRAWIHPAGPGPMIDLATYITSNGGTIPTGYTLEVAQAISANGQVIVGHGGSGAWLVQVRRTNCLGDITGDNNVNVSDLLSVITSWGECVDCPPDPFPFPPVLVPVCGADIAPSSPSSVGDCNVDVSDLLAVITSWGACPPPVGGCCLGATCQQMTESACATAGGVYLGNGSPCTLIACVNNDSCANAINITNKINGAAVQGDNSTATPPIFGGGDPELPVGSPSCHWIGEFHQVHSTVWYSFVAPANGSVTIGMCNTTPQPFVDSIMALYSGSCGSLVEQFCDEDSCAAGAYPYLSRIVATGLTPGATYRLAVMNPGGWGGSVPGPFTLNITSP